MGPTLLFDKSAFQLLSRDEHTYVFAHFIRVLPPILALEIVADLEKEAPAGATPEDIVRRLAQKFLGSGPPVHVGHTSLLRDDLMVANIRMEGRPYPVSVQVPDAGHGEGLYIPPTPTNEGIWRWSHGQFEDYEKDIARQWRAAQIEFPADSLIDSLRARGVEVPRVGNIEGLEPQVTSLLDNSELAYLWLDWLVNKTEMTQSARASTYDRWLSARTSLSTFSPYGHYCMAVDLRYIIASRSNLLRVQATDPLDLQYLYYVPFFQVFVSEDTLHVRLAPLGMRPDQDFVKGSDLKADIRERLTESATLDPAARERRAFALGLYPTPRPGSPISMICKKHSAPWNPGIANQAVNISAEEKVKALEEARQLFDKL